MLSTQCIIFLEIQFEILELVLLGYLDLTALCFQVVLLRLEGPGGLLCYAEGQEKVLWVVFFYVRQGFVGFRVELLQVLEGWFEVCQTHAHLQVDVAAVGHRLTEGYTQDFTDKKILLTNTHTLPSHHELSNHASMIASFLPMELNKQILSSHLVKRHVKRTLPCDEYILPIDILADLRHFEHKWRLQAYLFVLLCEIRDQQLLELTVTETLNF